MSCGVRISSFLLPLTLSSPRKLARPRMKTHIWPVAVVLIAAFNFCGLAARAAVATNIPVLIATDGLVEVSKAGAQTWRRAQTSQVLQVGDRVRTGDDGRAMIRLWDNCIMRVPPNGRYEIQASPDGRPGAKVNRGSLYLFIRDLIGANPARTELAAAATRGTEFHIFVDDNGRSVFTVIDGEVKVQNALGEETLTTGQEAEVVPGAKPQRTASLEMSSVIQWCLYYPAVLDPGELPFEPEESQRLADSLAAYVQGDLPHALQAYRAAPAPSEAERVYAAALWLALAEVPRAKALLAGVKAPGAASLLRLISVVQNQAGTNALAPATASEWMAESYYFQSRSDLERALAAAREATRLSPQFGFAWSRVAELEFSFGRSELSRQALRTALELSPHNAQAWTLQGFVHAAQSRQTAAFDAFEKAVALDGMLPTAWLGRGLVKIRLGDSADGRRDLQAAAALQPTYAIFRSYLGKALAQEGNAKLAEKDLTLAQRLDPNDPTAWLYSALLRQQRNEINAAIRDLEHSQELNDNRSLYRSRLLLDQDRAVRSANLANIYLDAGMTDVSVREAAKGVNYDYANYSAHLFLADSYDALRDPTRFNLRYETVWFNELLLANILAPVGGARLAQGISAQEYSRLFEADKLSLANSAVARTDGMIHNRASQFGTFGKTSYALDLDYQHHDGVRPNNELESIEWYTTVKQQITPQDSALVLVKYEDYHSGDNFQYYDPRQARRNFSFDEKQEPILVGAWHHEWSPGMHTMFLGGRLINEQHFTDRKVPQIVLFQDANGTVDGRASTGVDVDYHSQFEIYSAELNQICDWRWVTISAGARYQSGTFETKNLLENPTSIPFLLSDPPVRDSVDEGFERITGYGYVILKPLPQLRLTGGLAYDQETIPRNFRHPPIGSGEDERSHVGPKAALAWTPIKQATVRGVYTRSLGGVSLDESYRLEPTQLGGFPQAFRSVISESIVGSVAAPTYETFGLALDLKLGPRTYAGIQAEQITSEIRRRIGVLTLQNGIPPATPSSIGENLDYDERSLVVSINQLLNDEFVVGARYKVTRAELDDNFYGVPNAVLTPAFPSQRATLHQATGYLLFNHASGFFARAEVEWHGQENSGYAGTQPGDDVVQENFYIGYRFPRGHGQIRIGVLNVSDQDYRLNPLTVYQELPRERVFEARLSFIF